MRHVRTRNVTARTIAGLARAGGRRRLLAWISLLAVGALVPAASSAAAPTEVSVRIEGRNQTLFEGPILTEGHAVEARSEDEPHSCDGIDPNDPQNTAPGATPTAAAVDAMAISGGTFDGRWNSGFDDFFVTEWAGEREAEGNSWSVLVDGALLSVGGCQYELGEGTQVLWVYGATRQLLALYPQGAAEGPPPLTAVAEVGVPFPVEVLARKPASGSPPAEPTRTGFSPLAGAQIVPVATASNGAETPLVEQALATSGGEGGTTITFSTPGWHRIKALAPGSVRSNRIDVCVCAPAAASCGQVPADDLPRSSGSQPPEPPTVGCAAASTGGASSGGGGHLGPGTVAAGSPVTPAPGSSPTSLRLDGRPLAAHGALWRQLRYRGRWRRRRDGDAIDGFVMAGSEDARAQVRLGPGRPVFALLAASPTARVEVRAGRTTRVVLIRRTRNGTHPLLVVLAQQRHASLVSLRVLGGVAELDGVALAPR